MNRISNSAFLKANISSYISPFGECKFLGEQSFEQELVETEFHFAVWKFVFELELVWNQNFNR